MASAVVGGAFGWLRGRAVAAMADRGWMEAVWVFGPPPRFWPMISGGGRTCRGAPGTPSSRAFGWIRTIRRLSTTRFSEVLTNERTNKQTFPHEQTGKSRFTRPPPTFIISAGANACEPCLSPPPILFFYHWIDTGRADFIWDGGSGPSGCLLLPTYEAYLSEEPA